MLFYKYKYTSKEHRQIYFIPSLPGAPSAIAQDRVEGLGTLQLRRVLRAVGLPTDGLQELLAKRMREAVATGRLASFVEEQRAIPRESFQCGELSRDDVWRLRPFLVVFYSLRCFPLCTLMYVNSRTVSSIDGSIWQEWLCKIVNRARFLRPRDLRSCWLSFLF